MLAPAIYREALERDVAALVAAARRGLDAPVPSCPGWTVAILVAHLAGIYAHRTVLAQGRSTTNPVQGWIGLPEAYEAFFDAVFDDGVAKSGRALPPVPEGLVDFLEHSAAALVRSLWSLDSTTPIWTWFAADQTAGFWQRRMALETAIHRWDVELAYGMPTEPEAELAADGIDEVLDVMLPANRESARQGAGETYHFHRTDGPGEWLVQFEPAGPVVSRRHQKGDVALRGPAATLFLWLWHRIPADTLEVHGDTTLLERYFELAPPN